MHLRLYNEQKDFEHIAGWIDNERTHAFWSANTLPYPLTEGELHNYLIDNVDEHGGAYVYVDERDIPAGFFVYTVNGQERLGFVRFIVVDNTARGRGYGSDMLRKLLRFAYEDTGVSKVRLNVFDVNAAAMRCYQKVGFTLMDSTPTSFSFEDEIWKRYMMEHIVDKM